MKLNELRRLIREELENIKEKFSIDSFDVKDEVGKFFVVTKPKNKKTTLEDIVFESDIFNFANQIKEGLAFEDVVGIYKQKTDSRRKGTEVLKEYESQLKELENSMSDWRKGKEELEEKRKKAKEIALGLKR